MKTAKWANCLGIAALLAALCARPALADLYWETESVSTNLPCQRNGTSVQKYYLTPNASRVELSDRKVFIVDYNAMVLFFLDTKKRTCTALNLAQLPRFPGLTDANQKKVGQMLGAMMAVRISPTDESRTIVGYRCRKYDVRIAMVKGEYWVSKDVRGYRELKILGAEAGAIAERNPVLRQIDVAGMIERLDGFPVYTVNHVMGVTVASTLKKVEQKSLDPALFVVPKGYTMKKSR